MTRSELIKCLASRFPSLVITDSTIAVKTILDALSAALASGNRVEIRGFGTFGTRARPPRRGRNPKTSDQVAVPEKQVPIFKAGTEMREKVNK